MLCFRWVSAVCFDLIFTRHNKEDKLFFLTSMVLWGPRHWWLRHFHLFNILTFTNIIFQQGRILTVAGVTIALCCTPFVAFSNLVAVAIWPTWKVVALSETLRKVCCHWLSHFCSSILFCPFYLITWNLFCYCYHYALLWIALYRFIFAKANLDRLGRVKLSHLYFTVVM